MDWSSKILACPLCRSPLKSEELARAELHCAGCGPQGEIREGVLRFKMDDGDSNISHYQSSGGARFHERAAIPFTMSSLDTPIYHAELTGFRPLSTEELIVDIGAGDGRNTRLWLELGYRRIVAIDASFDALARLRSRLSEQERTRVLFVQADIRALPLTAASAGFAFAIESLYYLNEDYESGLAECSRILQPQGRLLISERSWEGAVFTALLYGDLGACSTLSGESYLHEKQGDRNLRTRCFREPELRALLQKNGFEIGQWSGTSLLALLSGYLRGAGKLDSASPEQFTAFLEFARSMAAENLARRTHLIRAIRN